MEPHSCSTTRGGIGPREEKGSHHRAIDFSINFHRAERSQSSVIDRKTISGRRNSNKERGREIYIPKKRRKNFALFRPLKEGGRGRNGGKGKRVYTLLIGRGVELSITGKKILFSGGAGGKGGT